MTTNTDTQIIITANDFTTGEVVYLSDRGWQPWIKAAHLYPDLDSADEAMAFAARPDEVVGAYVIAVELKDGVIVPTQFREKVRALGPTNYFHGKQAG
ncbi:MAG: DUF2849 domain-containing protein [Candidatus Puniceispirillales bacterium]